MREAIRAAISLMREATSLMREAIRAHSPRVTDEGGNQGGHQPDEGGNQGALTESD